MVMTKATKSLRLALENMRVQDCSSRYSHFLSGTTDAIQHYHCCGKQEFHSCMTACCSCHYNLIPCLQEHYSLRAEHYEHCIQAFRDMNLLASQVVVLKALV